MTTFRVPFALAADGTLIVPEQTTPGGTYRCLACADRLILKAGRVRAHHFAHQANGQCSSESVTHQTAKRLIQHMIAAWKSGQGPKPQIFRTCERCRTEIEQPLSDRVAEATLEWRMANGYVVDVGLLVQGEVAAAVEIRVTHAVGEQKSGELTVPFVEVDGYQILEDPLHWRTITARFSKLAPCAVCDRQDREAAHRQAVAEREFQQETAAARRDFDQWTARIARDSGIPRPTAYYRYSPYRCWNCRNGCWSSPGPISTPISRPDWPIRRGPGP